MDFVKQCRTASRKPDMYHTVSRTAIGKDFTALHRLCRIPIAYKGLSEPIHFGDCAALALNSCGS